MEPNLAIVLWIIDRRTRTRFVIAESSGSQHDLKVSIRYWGRPLRHNLMSRTVVKKDINTSKYSEVLVQYLCNDVSVDRG